MSWALLGVIVSIVGLPMSLVALILQAIRQEQADFSRCLHRIEQQYTTKHEWERELTRVRSRIDRLTVIVTELATRIRTDQGWLAQLERDRRQLFVMNERIADLARKAAPS